MQGLSCPHMQGPLLDESLIGHLLVGAWYLFASICGSNEFPSQNKIIKKRKEEKNLKAWVVTRCGWFIFWWWSRVLVEETV